MKEQIKKQLRELDQKQQDFVQRIGEARDLLAELMFTSDAFFTLQKRELIHHMTANCEHNPENQYTRDGIIFCNDCGNSLGFVGTDVHELPTKINYCPYADNGWCYAKENIVTNAINSGCFKPQECPANQGK